MAEPMVAVARRSANSGGSAGPAAAKAAAPPVADPPHAGPRWRAACPARARARTASQRQRRAPTPSGAVTVDRPRRRVVARLRRLDGQPAVRRPWRSARSPPAPAPSSANARRGAAAPPAARRRHGRATTARSGRTAAWPRARRPTPTRSQQQRRAVRPAHQHLAVQLVDRARCGDTTAPSRARGGVAQPGSSAVTGCARAERRHHAGGTAPSTTPALRDPGRPRRQHRRQRRIGEAVPPGEFRPDAHQQRPALAHIVGDVLQIERRQHAAVLEAVEDDEVEFA